MFKHTRLRNADLTNASHLRIDPEANDLRGARFPVDGALSLLAKYGVQVE